MKFAITCLILFITSVFVSLPAHSSYVFSLNTVKATKESKQQLSVRSSQQAAQMAKGRYGGKVLKVQKQKSGYRVKLIKTNGHIVSVYVDAITGRISGGK